MCAQAAEFSGVVVAASPDDRNIYLAGYFSDSISTFARHRGTGILTYLGCIKGTLSAPEVPVRCSRTAPPLTDPLGTVVSPDGESVYSAMADTLEGGGSGIAFFSRALDSEPAPAAPAVRTGEVELAGSAVSIPISCPVGATSYCDAEVSVEAQAASGRTTRKTVLGRKRFRGRIRRGRTSVKVRLARGAGDARRVKVRVVRFNPNGTRTARKRVVRLSR